MYRLGIARKAAPLERLKGRHQAFLARIMAPPSGVVPDDDPQPPPRPSSSRSVLGQVGGGGLSTVSGATPLQQQPQRISRGTNGSKLEIFSDASGAAADPEASQWEDFGTRDGRRKENTIEATPWKGETLPQSAARHRVAPRTPKLEVFKDTSDNGAVRHADDQGLVIRSKAPLSEAELLRDDPLKNYDTSNVSKTVPTLPPPPTSARKPAPKKRREAAHVMQPWVCPTGGPERPTAKGKIERCMFDWDATFKGGEEWSFQEVRAKKLGLFGRDWKPLKDWEKSWHGPGATTPKKEVKRARPPSPTLNTKLANEEVMSLFNQTIHGGKVRDPDFDTDSDDDDDDDDEEVDEVAPLPTPLPPRQPERQMLSMMTPGGMIPPTPTPAQGANARRVSPQMNVFADENATPAPSRLAVFADENATPAPRPQVFADENASASTRKVNVFADSTPKPKPLGRTPLAPSASKPRAFGVLEEPATPSANIFAATPAPAAKIASPIPEEDESAAQNESENSAPSRKASPVAPVNVVDETAAPSRKASPLAQVNVFGENAGPSRRASPLAQTNAFDENAIPSRVASPLAQPRVFDENAVPSAVPSRKSSPLGQSIGPASDENAVPSRRSSPLAQSAGPFVDENAGPSRRASPLAQRPGPVSDENATPFRQTSPAAQPNGNAFDENAPLRQPSPIARPNGNVFDENVPRADAEASDAVPGQYEEYEEYYTDDEPAGYGRPMKNFAYKSIMTPVTERTENTIFANMTMRSEMLSEAEEEDEERPSPRAPSLSAVAEADEPASRRRESGQSASSHGHSSAFDGNCSGSVDTGAFQIPDGYTIHGTGADVTLGQVRDADVEDRAPETTEAAAAAPAAVLSQIPNPCCPTDEAVIATLLSRMDPPFVPVASSSKSGRLSKLQASAKTRARRSSSMSRSSLAPQDDAYRLTLGEKEYEMREKLGEGGFGAVFAAVDVATRSALLDRDDSDDEDDVDETSTLVAIKVESPASQWEAAMLERVHSRLPSDLLTSIIRPRGLHLYADESFLLLDYSAQGTLLDVVNKASVWGISAIPNGPSVPDEIVALFFTAELLRLVEGLHAQGMIHGDLKIDNCMVRLDSIPVAEGGNSAWSTQYDRHGKNGWKHKGVRLIDFGRAQDLTLFDSGTQRFVADWKTDARDCPAMRRGDPWSFETDYFGLAGVCYCLLFGKFIATETEGGKVKVDQGFKRYWQVNLWTKVFDTLLNPYDDEDGERGPILDKLRELREALEDWLEVNCQKNGKSLKQLLKRIELRAMERR